MSRLTPDTTNLLGRLAAGCDRARSQLIAHSCDRLRCVAQTILREDFSRLRRWEQTDDVLQNALLRLSRALATAPLESSAHFWNLAAALIRRELLDLARHHFGPEGQAANHHTDGSGAARQTSGEPSSPLEWADFLGRVEKLPEEERQVFDLYWVQELTQQEVAANLKVSVRTVKRLWQSARRNLARALREGGYWEEGGP